MGSNERAKIKIITINGTTNVRTVKREVKQD
jgi:hypothetical protein